MTDVVSLTLPTEPGWTGVAELVLAGLGARLDLPYDRIDELQLATSAGLAAAAGAEVRVEASASDDHVDVRVGPLAADAGDPGRRRVLDALADGVELGQGEDGAMWAVLTFARGGAR